MIGWHPQAINPNLASFRYRCLNPLTELRSQGFPVELYDAGRESEYDAVIFSKRYGIQDQKLAETLKNRGSTVILDLCDNHFYNPFDLPAYRVARKNLLEMITLADVLICSTETLADEVVNEAGLSQRPYVVGDAIEEFPVADRNTVESLISLVWFGMHGSPNAPSGMLDVLRLEPLLNELNNKAPLEVVVTSNNREKFDAHLATLAFPTRYVEWTGNSFPLLLATASAVVIPISVNRFTACKTNNRLATALYAGVPVVADCIPSYQELGQFCYLDQWEAGLNAILSRAPEPWQRAARGQQFVRQHYLISQIARRWVAVLNETVSMT